MRTRKNIKISVWVVFFVLFPTISSMGLKEREWREGLFRVNSSVSSGDMSLERIAKKARDAGFEFIVFSDQFLVHCEYGLPPLRNVIKKAVVRPGIVEYGIGNYFSELDRIDDGIEGLTIVPGADIAPLYYWERNPAGGGLVCRQFSEQLTVFGPSDPVFYRNLPVIHNDRMGFELLDIVRILPMLLCIAGLILVFSKPPELYSDRQGHSYSGGKRKKICAGTILLVTGIVWTLENRPFVKDNGMSPYRDSGTEAYQKVIDYLRNSQYSASAGIIWSAPEATMKDKIGGIELLTLPYLDDIENTFGHNGFAGIYGDVADACDPGGFWEKMLDSYCRGIRKIRPVIVGESDYHGRGRMDFIKTVVYTRAKDRKSILGAILSGASYAVFKQNGMQPEIHEFFLESGSSRAVVGETLNAGADSKINLVFKGGINGVEPGFDGKTRITVVHGGRILARENFSGRDFDMRVSIPPKKHDVSYVRINLSCKGAGAAITNPIFYRSPHIAD